MLEATWKKNDAKAKKLIIIFSVIVLVAVSALGRYNLAGKVEFPFDDHLFALANAIINAAVAILLVAGLITVKNQNHLFHQILLHPQKDDGRYKKLRIKQKGTLPSA